MKDLIKILFVLSILLIDIPSYSLGWWFTMVALIASTLDSYYDIRKNTIK